MPTPMPREETKKEWMDRCIPVVLSDNTAQTQDQAVAICEQMWRDANKSYRESVEALKNTAKVIRK